MLSTPIHARLLARHVRVCILCIATFCIGGTCILHCIHITLHYILDIHPAMRICDAQQDSVLEKVTQQ